MIALLGVELSRFRSRRAIVALVILAAVLTGVLAAKAAYDTRPLSASDLETAEAQAKIASEQPDTANTLNECLKDPSVFLGPGGTTQQCHDDLLPTASDYLPRSPLDVSNLLDGVGVNVALLVVGLLMIACCTYAGADWASGSIRTQLLFEPRRLRLWTAKAVVATVASGLIALVVLGGYWLAVWLVCLSRDLEIPPATMTDLRWHLARAVVLAMGAGLGAFAITMLFRHTVATLALLFAYSAGSEVLVNLISVSGIARWTLGNNVFGWLKEGFRYFDEQERCRPLSECSRMHDLGHLDSGLFLLALLAVALVASVISFTRRGVQ